MACYIGRRSPGHRSHLFVGDGHTRHALCGLTAWPGSRSAWSWWKLTVKEGQPVVETPVSCRKCIQVLMGVQRERWDWGVKYDE